MSDRKPISGMSGISAKEMLLHIKSDFSHISNIRHIRYLCREERSMSDRKPISGMSAISGKEMLLHI